MYLQQTMHHQRACSAFGLFFHKYHCNHSDERRKENKNEPHSEIVPPAAVETTDLLLELLAFLRGESVCFGDHRDDIDFLMQPFHELDVQGLQSAER